MLFRLGSLGFRMSGVHPLPGTNVCVRATAGHPGTTAMGAERAPARSTLDVIPRVSAVMVDLRSREAIRISVSPSMP